MSSNQVLLSETIGGDTASQVYRDASGAHLLVILALPEGGGEKTLPEHSPRVWQRRPIGKEEALAHYQAAAAVRHVPLAAAFPG